MIFILAYVYKANHPGNVTSDNIDQFKHHLIHITLEKSFLKLTPTVLCRPPFQAFFLRFFDIFTVKFCEVWKVLQIISKCVESKFTNF